MKNREEPLMNRNDMYKTAIFAGGCFWCMEQPYREIEGVIDVQVGYSGGTTAEPNYEQVASGLTDHYESVRVIFDPSIVGYDRLVDVFWRQIDPTDSGGQFADRGNHYKTVIFYSNAEQKEIAEVSLKQLQDSTKFTSPIATQILPATEFYPAEEYHQSYYKKNSVHYSAYKRGSGRAGFIQEFWAKEDSVGSYAKPESEDLRKTLTPLQYHVTQEDGTEPPFDNELWDNKEEGIYVDIVSGEPLFCSLDKFDSGTGWPSFTRPLVMENIVEKEDRKLFSVRTEVRSQHGDSHLGHVFPDGPAPTHQRFCINSASLRFIPKDRLEEEGYGDYVELFQ